MGESVTVMGYSQKDEAKRMREWRSHNREQDRLNARNYYYRNKDKVLAKERKWNKEHRKELRDYERQTRLSVNGKRIRVKKRKYPENQKCELCTKNISD